jgi:hypothetical protein
MFTSFRAISYFSSLSHCVYGACYYLARQFSSAVCEQCFFYLLMNAVGTERLRAGSSLIEPAERQLSEGNKDRSLKSITSTQSSMNQLTSLRLNSGLLFVLPVLWRSSINHSSLLCVCSISLVQRWITCFHHSNVAFFRNYIISTRVSPPSSPVTYCQTFFIIAYFNIGE